MNQYIRNSFAIFYKTEAADKVKSIHFNLKYSWQ